MENGREALRRILAGDMLSARELVPNGLIDAASDLILTDGATTSYRKVLQAGGYTIDMRTNTETKVTEILSRQAETFGEGTSPPLRLPSPDHRTTTDDRSRTSPSSADKFVAPGTAVSGTQGP